MEVIKEIDKKKTPEKEVNYDYMTLKDLALALNVSSRTIEKWQQERRIPYYKIGNAVRFNYSEVEAAIVKRVDCAN